MTIRLHHHPSLSFYDHIHELDVVALEQGGAVLSSCYLDECLSAWVPSSSCEAVQVVDIPVNEMPS